MQSLQRPKLPRKQVFQYASTNAYNLVGLPSSNLSTSPHIGEQLKQNMLLGIKAKI
jgi:hypothetical protein